MYIELIPYNNMYIELIHYKNITYVVFTFFTVNIDFIHDDIKHYIDKFPLPNQRLKRQNLYTETPLSLFVSY